MERKKVRILIVVLAAVMIMAGTFSGGVIVGWVLPASRAADLGAVPEATTETIEATTTKSAGSSNIQLLFEPFWQTWDLVHDQYIDQPINDELLMQGAMRGMLESLGDPHTSYMDPTEYEMQKMPLNGSYEGIGVWVDTTGEYLTIISPIPGTPAEAAGLKSGDQVIAVDGEDVTGMDGDLIIRRILGPEGTKVLITVRRESEPEPISVEIVRARITVPSVSGEILEQKIAYVQISTFGANTDQELHDTLRELMQKEPIGMILDLRYNGGGYLDTAVEVVSEFVKGNQVALLEEMSNGTQKTWTTGRNGLATEIPLVVLVNEGTASASEITAGAIQDYGRGVLVGTTTYGKGSVQNWIALANDQGAVRITVARWLTPNGRQINDVGLEPDVVVEITEQDVEKQVDPQLQKAIEILTSPVS